MKVDYMITTYFINIDLDHFYLYEIVQSFHIRPFYSFSVPPKCTTVNKKTKMAFVPSKKRVVFVSYFIPFKVFPLFTKKIGGISSKQRTT